MMGVFSHRLVAAVVVAITALAGHVPVARASDSCVTTDADLLAQVEAKVQRHTSETGRTDLREMFSRSLGTMKGQDTYTTADLKARPDKQGDNWQGAGPNPLWQAVYAELDRLQACREAQSAVPPPTPAVSISGGAGVTEGGTASFTVSASPAPQSSLTVTLAVSQSGDYAAVGSTGSKTVTIPTSGSASYSVATVDDSVDESDGSVSVAVQGGNGYTVATSSSASVSVADNDAPPVPAVSISGGSGVTEGGTASFTVSASPAPQSSLTVTLAVSQSGDYAAVGSTGSKTVTIPASGSASYSVATVDDSVDESDGSVSVAVQGGNGYTVGTSSSASVSVADNDVAATPAVSISGGSGVTEGGTASFTLSASPAPQSSLTVTLAVSQSGDYAASGATGTKTVSIPASGSASYSVATVDDSVDESDGSVSVAVQGGNGYTVGTSSSASVSVADNDSPPVPAVSISGGSGVTEGGTASFTVSASPAPQSALTVTLAVSQSGDYAASGATGTKTVSIPTSGSASYSVATVDDSVDEADGSVSVAVQGGNGYTVASNSSASVSVADNDAPPATPAKQTGTDLDASPPAQNTVQVLSNGDVLLGWPGQKGATYDLKALPFTDFRNRQIRLENNYAKNWYVWKDLPPGEWSLTVQSGGETLFTQTVTVPQKGPDLDASPPSQNTVRVLPNGDVLLGWPVKEGFPNLELRAVSFEGHATRYEYGYSKNWYVWKDLQPGKWVLSIYYGTGPWLHGRLLFVTVPEKGEQAVITYDVTVSGGAGVTEGGTATFTFSASPSPPAAGLAVTIHVSQRGNYAAGGATGTKTVTIPASGSATYSVATVDDKLSEPDGAIRVSTPEREGYLVLGTSKNVSVPVRDNDTATVSISAGAGVTEGGTVSFTLTADNHWPPLPVSLTVGQNGYFAADGATGTKTVTIPASGSATFSVATVDDDRDEADGSLVAVVNAGDGYIVSGQPHAEAPVWDNDVVGAGADCVTSDADLLAKVQAQASYHAGSGQSDLHEMFTRSLNTMHGKDTYTVPAIKTRPDKRDQKWQGAGPDELWQKIYTELDRLEVCRGPQVTQIVDNTPGGDELNSGQTVTITPVNPGTPQSPGITEGSDAEFTIMVSPASPPFQDILLSVTSGVAGDPRPGGPRIDLGNNTSVASVRILPLRVPGFIRVDTSGVATLRVPTVDDHTDEPNAQVWVAVAEDNDSTPYSIEGWANYYKVNVADNDDPVAPGEEKRIPWMEGQTVVWTNRGGNAMIITWGMPVHYKEGEAIPGHTGVVSTSWRGDDSVRYCIEMTGGPFPIVRHSDGTVERRPPPMRCSKSLWSPEHLDTDSYWNGGGRAWFGSMLFSPQHETTYEFTIWVEGDKDASKATFKYTTTSKDNADVIIDHL